jgi:hypothetical protein
MSLLAPEKIDGQVLQSLLPSLGAVDVSRRALAGAYHPSESQYAVSILNQLSKHGQWLLQTEDRRDEDLPCTGDTAREERDDGRV